MHTLCNLCLSEQKRFSLEVLGLRLALQHQQESGTAKPGGLQCVYAYNTFGTLVELFYGDNRISTDQNNRWGRTMIDNMRSMTIFATVVDRGSFRAAAQYLSLSPSWVSEAVSKLEKDTGVQLLYRSTRHLSLTLEGSHLYEEAKVMLGAAERGLDAIKPLSKEPTGLLRVTLPAFVTQTPLMDTIQHFVETFPRIKLNLDFTDSPRNLIKDGIDVGIRVGWLEDSELRIRKIGQSHRMLVVSTDHAARRKTPEHPSDLQDWDWIGFTHRGNHTELTSEAGETIKIQEQSAVTANSADAVFQLLKRGIGVTPLPETLARAGIERGDFVHLLPSWTLEPLSLYAVWPNRALRENLTSLFVNFILDANKDADSDTQKIL